MAELVDVVHQVDPFQGAPSGARAGQSRLVDLTFTDLRQLAKVAAGLRNVIRRHGLARITGEFVEAVEYRAQLRECVEGAMGSPWKVEALLFSERASQRAVLPLSSSLDGAGSMSIPITPDHRARQAYLYVRLPCATAASGGAG